MMKSLFLISMLLFLSISLSATQTYVVAELFSTTTCPWCPSARSALNQLSQNDNEFPFLIPVIFQGNGEYASQGYNSRRNLYGFTGIPYARFAGNIPSPGGGDQAYNRYVNAYNQAVNRNAPMTIDIMLNLDDNNNLVIEADVNMTANISTTRNNIIFLLTYDLTGIMDPDYFASVIAYHSESFPLDSIGQSQVFKRVKNIQGNDWDLHKITAVVFVQSFDEDNTITHQAGKKSFDGLTSLFYSNVRKGPSELHVQFYNNSLSNDEIELFAWDLTGDGTIDSFEENPLHVYKEPGNYNVSLSVTAAGKENTLRIDDYIEVTGTDNIFGNISGVWRKELSPYIVTGDLSIPKDSFLEIEPGVTVMVEDESAIEIRGKLIAHAAESEPIIFRSETSWNGVHILNREEKTTITNVQFLNASGVPLRVSNAPVDLIGCLFYNNNTSGVNPGAIAFRTSESLIKNCIFANNVSAAVAGVMDVEGTKLKAVNNLFVNNSGNVASTFFLRRGADVEFINNTLTHNSYVADTGAHILNSGSNLMIKNSIVRGDGHLFGALSGSVFLVEHSNISGGFEGVEIIDSDPMFVQPSQGAGAEYDGMEAIWHLQENSPSVDAGNPSQEYYDPEDGDNPGYAKFPSRGTLVNDQGTYGGSGTAFWVSIEDDYLQNPQAYTMIKAYPNPFNPNITISLANLDYDRNKPIVLEILNIKGQTVRSLVNNQVTFNQEFSWDGMNEDFLVAPSGVYFIRFTDQEMVKSHKILLLK